MITKSIKLNLKLVYQVTHRMMICPSKCRPLNSTSTGTNGCILPSSPIAACLNQKASCVPAARIGGLEGCVAKLVRKV